MSATPPTGAPSHSTPNGKPVIKRKPVGVDPLVQKKKPPVYRPPPAKKPAQPTANGRPSPAPRNAPRPPSAHASPDPGIGPKVDPKKDVSGFSDPQAANYQDFKLVTTKRQLLEGLRHHVLNIIGNQNLDLQNEDQFTRPVRLHRRDPRAQQPGQPAKEDADEPPPNDMDKTEREAYLKRKQERQKEREANLAQIAPSINEGKKIKNFTKKSEQVFRPNQSAEQRQKYREKYEETYPWHLEDFDNKHCLVGQNQPTMSRLNAALALEPDPTGQSAGRCRIIPVEKWYKFAPKTRLETPSLEEVEKRMKKGSKDPEFLAKFIDEYKNKKRAEQEEKTSRRLYTAPIERAGLGDGRDPDGVADLDFDEDFADDEEGNTFGEEKDEDTKLAEERIKKEQLSANIFDARDERVVDLEEQREQLMKAAQSEISRKLNKSLRRREGNFNLGSDSEDNPYEEDSESEDSEEEAARKAAEEAAKSKEEKATLSAAEGTKSGTSSKGTNTPSSRKEKHGGSGGISDRDSGPKKIKRPGSRSVSDAGSGTDASTSHRKSKHLKPPAPGTRLPESKKRKSLAPSSTRPGGAGSDSDGAAFSDGATSDGGKPKRLKLTSTSVSPPGSPPGSRAASPPTASPSSAGAASFPSPAEVTAAIPPAGILAMDLFKLFRTRVPQEHRNRFWSLMKQVGDVDKRTKIVYPRGAAGAAPSPPPPAAS